MKRITVMGGGTGTFVVLSGLKRHNLDLGVIVNMMDSGGSTGRLRVQLGVLPPGDIRQCFVALSEASDFWRKLFLYRFEQGDLKGHNFGNIFLSALEKTSEKYDIVLKTLGFILKTKGSVIPVTYEKTHLCVEYENGGILKGEGYIDENLTETSKIKRAFLEPSVRISQKAFERILKTDYIVVGPGDLYTSIIPLFLVNGMKAAMKKTKAKIVYVVNLMTKSGQTAGYTASDHVKDLEKYMGKKVDTVIIHKGIINPSISRWYEAHKEKRVKDDMRSDKRVVRSDVADNTPVEKNTADTLSRSILRHDSEKLANEILKLV